MDQDETTEHGRAKRETKRDQAAGSRRARGQKKRGRTILAIVLLLFVAVASAVIWRRSHGIMESRHLSDLDRQRQQLEAERARLQSLIRDESSRSRLAPVVQAQGMRVPSDAQVRILPR